MIQEVFDRASPPSSAVCLVFSTFPNGATLRGTAVIVGRNDVLTALHLVYEEGFGGWATHVYVTPAADTSPFDAPFGTFSDVGRIAGRRPDWDVDGDGLVSASEAQFDLALVGFRTAIGDAAGWLQPLALAQDVDGIVTGYPASVPAGVGLGLMQNLVTAHASQQFGVYEVPYSLGAGTSGGPLVVTSGGQAFVAGIASSASLDDTRSTYAALFGEGTWDWLVQAMSANDGLMLPLAENVAGTAGNDSLDGNGLPNAIDAGAGDDTLRGWAGNDTLAGGEGIDTALYAGLRASYSWVHAGAHWSVTDSVSARDGTDALDGVERLRFDDGWLALDLDGHAGVAARILGAVFGAGSVSARPDYVGIGLALLDAGMDERELVQQALVERFGGRPASVQLVDTLYANVVGALPTTAVQAHYVDLIESGSTTAVDLAILAEQSPENALRIGLAGLASTGLAFQPAP